MSAKSYDYSPAHRLLEIVSIATMGLLIGLMFREVVIGSRGLESGFVAWLLPATVVAAYLVADFISGLVHFLADNFGAEDTPLVGSAFVKPFREHHVDPREMTRHDFIETNGNNSIICVPTALACYWFFPAREEVWALAALSFTAWFMIAIFMTNQFHKWAHLETPPAWIGFLQRTRLILAPGHHDVHHTPPFDRYYCITSGWLNPVLRAVRFFPALEFVLRKTHTIDAIVAILHWVTRTPRAPSPPPRTPARTAG